MDQEQIARATKFRRWLIHTWKPMTQTRVRQGAGGRSLALPERPTAWRPRSRSNPCSTTPKPIRAIPTLQIDAGPRIEVRSVGAKLSRKTLQRYIPVFEEHAVDHDLLVEGAHNLRDYFQSQGYFDAEVEFKEQNVVNDKAAIDYLINTGTRHKLVSIEINGNHYFNTETHPRAHVPAARHAAAVPPRALQRRPAAPATRAPSAACTNRTDSAEVKVTHQVVDNYLGKPGNIAVVLDVEEGPQQFIHSLQVEGIERLSRDQILPLLSSVAGQPFSEFNVAVDRDTILAQYFEKGFPRRDVRVELHGRRRAEPRRPALRRA